VEQLIVVHWFRILSCRTLDPR